MAKAYVTSERMCFKYLRPTTRRKKFITSGSRLSITGGTSALLCSLGCFFVIDIKDGTPLLSQHRKAASITTLWYEHVCNSNYGLPVMASLTDRKWSIVLMVYTLLCISSEASGTSLVGNRILGQVDLWQTNPVKWLCSYAIFASCPNRLFSLFP